MYPQRRCCPLGNRINVFSVPRDSVERTRRPLRESHHSTWLMMGALVATACGWIGCYLILQGMALLGDAISHTVLLGIVVASLVTGKVTGSATFIR